MVQTSKNGELMPSITDVAKKAGVSISTVSHVIHGTKHVSRELRERVNGVIEETGFQLDNVAGSVKSKRTKNIGVLLPKITMIFFPDVLEGIDAAAKERGYKLFYLSTNYDFDEEKENLRFLKSGWVDGILLDSCCKSSEMFEYSKLLTDNTAQKPIPVVSLENSFKSEEIGYVGIDHVKYTRMALQHLIDIGHKDIAILEGPEYLPLCIDNMRAYKETLEDAGIPIKKENYLYGDYLPQSGYKAIRQACGDNGKPSFTALFAANDQMAIGAIKASLDMGIKVPDLLAIMGFDNIFPSSLIEPQLSTIDVPRFDMGYGALNMLVDKIESKTNAKNELLLPGKLIIRNSTVKTAKSDWTLTGW